MFKSISPAAFVALNVTASVVAAYALTGDWRPALAVAALQTILLRVLLAVRQRVPVLAAAVSHLDHHHDHRLERPLKSA
jgi:uncharacterized membrane protein